MTWFAWTLRVVGAQTPYRQVKSFETSKGVNTSFNIHHNSLLRLSHSIPLWSSNNHPSSPPILPSPTFLKASPTSPSPNPKKLPPNSAKPESTTAKMQTPLLHLTTLLSLLILPLTLTASHPLPSNTVTDLESTTPQSQDMTPSPADWILPRIDHPKNPMPLTPTMSIKATEIHPPYSPNSPSDIPNNSPLPTEARVVKGWLREWLGKTWDKFYGWLS